LSPERAQELSAGLDGWLIEAFVGDVAPSVSVAVGIDEQVLATSACGLARVEDRTPATPATPYLLASATKPLAAATVTAVAARHGIDLDSPIEKFLGGVTLETGWPEEPPTIRQVLQHRGGIGAYFRPYYQDEARVPLAFSDVIERRGRVMSRPGERFVYSNLGYALLDELILNVTGQTPGEAMSELVFGPLGMTSGWLGADYSGPVPAAVPYAIDGVPYPPYDVEHPSASLAWCSAGDLVRFGLACAGSGIFLATISSPTPAPPITPEFRYELGWAVKSVGGSVVASHAGLMGGVHTLLVVLPTDGVAIAVLTNVTKSALPERLAKQVLEVLLPTLGRQITGFWKDDPNTPPSMAAALAAVKGSWRGALRHDGEPLPLELAFDTDGTVTARIGSGTTVPATATRDDNGDLAISIPCALPDEGHRTDTIELHLEPDDQEPLTGSAVASQTYDDRGRRVGDLVSMACQLHAEPLPGTASRGES